MGVNGILNRKFSSSLSLPQDPIDGGQHETASPPGGLQHPMVLILGLFQPPPGLFLTGDLQQHHPVPVRRQLQSRLHHNPEEASIPQPRQPTQRLRDHRQVHQQTDENPTDQLDESRERGGSCHGGFPSRPTCRTGHLESYSAGYTSDWTDDGEGICTSIDTAGGDFATYQWNGRRYLEHAF